MTTFPLRRGLLVGVIAVVAALAPAQGAEAQQILVIVTNPQGSLGYSTGAALGKVMVGAGGAQVRVQPIGGSSTYLPMINRGEHDMGFANTAEVTWAHQGAETFKTSGANANLRLVAITYPIFVALSVPFDFKAKTIRELKGSGARITNEYTAQTIFQALQDGSLATAGLISADLRPVPVPNFTNGMKLLGEGKADVSFTGPTTGVAQEANIALKGRGGLRHLPIETTPDAVERMRKHVPGTYVRIVQPAQNAPGVREPTPMMSYSNFLVAGAHMADEVVYQTTKLIHDKAAELGEAFYAWKDLDQRAMNEAHVVPYHAGAEKFYREIGQWPPKAR